MSSRAEVSLSTTERDTPIQLDKHLTVGMEDMMRQLQETMKAMQRDTAQQTEVTACQAEVVTQQAELIARLQQQ